MQTAAVSGVFVGQGVVPLATCSCCTCWTCLGQVVAKGGVFRYVVFGLYRAAAEGNQQKKSEKSCDLVCHMCVTSENSENIAKKLVEIQRITEKKKSPCIAL